jgi:hypothetical protein
MPEEYPKEELQKIYEALPEDLKEALFSEKTADDIYDVCVENGLEEKNSEIAKYVGYVLLGLLSPDEFEKALKEKLSLENGLAKKVSQQMYRLVFYPLKNSLEPLYKIKMAPPTPTSETTVPQKELPKEELAKEEISKKRKEKDIYREPID